MELSKLSNQPMQSILAIQSANSVLWPWCCLRAIRYRMRAPACTAYMQEPALPAESAISSVPIVLEAHLLGAPAGDPSPWLWASAVAVPAFSYLVGCTPRTLPGLVGAIDSGMVQLLASATPVSPRKLLTSEALRIHAGVNFDPG